MSTSTSSSSSPAPWEGWFTVAVVIVAFGCLLWDLIQPDHVMIGALGVLMASGVISVEEGLAGFANEGLLTVAVLFVVAAGISATGGLDWYMGKLLGRPRTVAGAQLRLMLPIAIVSAFLNNTPVVAVMIPIVQKWAENIHVPKAQVMMPLSFASILGGTCTLIGTSTNLVVLGMLRDWRGADGTSETEHSMGLFDLGLYGVPVALTGMTYMLLASGALLPGGATFSSSAAKKASSSRSSGGGGGGAADGASGGSDERRSREGSAGKKDKASSRGTEDLIVRAKIQPWSAACGETVAGSGLRGLPGLYLVSVQRDDALMRAVGPDFVLAQGDILFFTGMVESLGMVCAEHGLEAVTDEHDDEEDEEDEEEEIIMDESIRPRGGNGDGVGDRDDDLLREGEEEEGGGATVAPAAGSSGGSSSGSSAGSAPARADASTSSQQQRPLGVPDAVPEMSALEEIQLMARSQAIGGGANANANARLNASTRRGGGIGGGGGFSSDLASDATSGGETSDALSGGESDAGYRRVGGRAVRPSDDLGSGVPGSDSGELDPSSEKVRSASASASASASDRRRRRASRRRSLSLEEDVNRGADAHYADLASAVSLDPGERRGLKMYERRQRRERVSSGARGSSARSDFERRSHEVAKRAAERALGPPKVTVEPDPDARGDTLPNDPNGSGDASAGQGLRVVLGVSAADRPGLLHDISQGLNRLRVQLLHCEASAVAERSVSIWRLQAMDASTTREQIKTVIEALLSPVSGADAEKRKGARVARALVPAGSSLLGRTPAEVGFRKTYGAAIVGMQRQGRRPSGRIGQVRLREGDELVLQLADGSPLLEPAPSEEELEKHGVAPRALAAAFRADDEDKDPASNSLSRGSGGALINTPARSAKSVTGGLMASSMMRLSSSVGDALSSLGGAERKAPGHSPASGGAPDVRGVSLRRPMKTVRPDRDAKDAARALAADSSVSGEEATLEKVFDKDGASSSSSEEGRERGGEKNTASLGADSVSVAIPDLRGYSLRASASSPTKDEPPPLLDTPASELAERLRVVRDAHADLELVGAGADGGGGGRESEAGKEFLIAVRVEKKSQFARKTPDQAGLRKLPGLFLVSVERPRFPASANDGVPGDKASETVEGAPVASVSVATREPPGPSSPAAPSPPSSTQALDPESDVLREDDVLWYAGNAQAIASVRKIPGLAPIESADQVDKLKGVSSQSRRLIQAVVAKTGPLVGRSIRDMKFRSRYNAVVLAVHREGARVHARVGDVVLHPGDVLLLDAGPDFKREAAHSGSGFALVSVLEDSAPPRLRLLAPVLVIAVAMIATYTSGATELLVAAIFAVAFMIACGALTEQEARDAIKWDVIVTIAAAFGMSKALQNAGVAGTVAAKLVEAAEASGTGRAGLLTAVYFATFVISNVVTNNAAAALMFPIAADAAEREGETLQSMSFLVMLAASASFMSPFGYQTNLMVYGPGGYAFKDFLRFGVPMQLFQLVASVAVIVIGGKLWFVSWGGAGILFGVVAFAKSSSSSGGAKKLFSRGRGLLRRLLASGRATRGGGDAA